MGKTYEMLWDCEYCGSRKLLGKTHRFCPGCGAPQNAEGRYFPTEDEKVAVEDHDYVGADRECGACGSAMSAKASHCTQCGSPMESATEVRRVSALAKPAIPPRTPAPRKRGGFGKWLALGSASLAVGGFLVAMLWQRDVEGRVVGHSWERVVQVESLTPVHESTWCDEMPADAYDVTRRRDVRSHKSVAEGEDCRIQRIDNGDGTYREEEQCTPRYRKEPVYDEHCAFTVDRWIRSRSERSSGTDPGTAPYWPAIELKDGTCRGCEREQSRDESYRVSFASSDGTSFECGFDERRWRGFSEGSRWRVKVGVLTGIAACGSLEPAGP